MPVNTKDFLDYLKNQPYYDHQLVHIAHLPAKRARYGKLREGLPEKLSKALDAVGTKRLFSHQVQAIDLVRAGQHIVVATGTASGKTLCYNIPVLESILLNYRTRALYLFPTKALANDQLRSLSTLLRPLMHRPRIGVYDGDTPDNVRVRLRQEGSIILSNPDMLHLGVMPHHELWANFLRKLRFVIVDEAHTYRGVFGSHVAVVFRRLNRLCEYYGSQPQYIACSATISNPGEHVTRLTGREARVIDRDGAPKAGRIFVLWNPPYIDQAHSARRSAYAEASALFADMARFGIRNITFTKARVTAELILKYARSALKRTDPTLLERVASYRAGYLAHHRREMEEALAQGRLIGVTSTNALELGVDVGGLDATVSVGFPGSIASLWQQVGRSGRRANGRHHPESLAIMVGLDNPLDQYFMHHPEDLLDRPSEHALIDPGNLYVLQQHLACAAIERPLTPQDEQHFDNGFVQAMIELENKKVLVYQAKTDQWTYMGPNYPARQVNIRSMAQKPVTLIDESESGRRLEVMDVSMAPARVHPGAIYIHRGESYRVRTLDLNTGVAKLLPAEVDYYTQAREINNVKIVEALQQQVHKRAVVYWGTVRVTQRVVAYRRVRHFTENRGQETPLDLPSNSFQTRAVWWSLPREWQWAVGRRGWNFSGGLRAIEHAMSEMLPLFAMCDRFDIGGHTSLSHPETGLSHIFIYDTHPGGVGISEQGFLLITDLWRATLSAIQDCLCAYGCPSCIYSPRGGDKNEKLDKRAAVWIFEALLKG